MMYSTRERSSAYELTWSLDVRGHEVELEYKVEAFEELYVFDRLWNLDRARGIVPESLGIYRYVRDGHLWLVFAQAPSPPEVIPLVYHEPLSSKVLAGSTHGKSVKVALPVDEYSAIERNIHAPTALEQVSRVVFVLGYRRRATLDAAPYPPPDRTAEDAGYIVYGPDYMVSVMAVDPLPVKRRTDAMARFRLPTER